VRRQGWGTGQRPEALVTGTSGRSAAAAGGELIHRDRRDDLDPELAGWLDAIERSGWRLRDLVREVADLVNRAEPEKPVERRPSRMRAV